MLPAGLHLLKRSDKAVQDPIFRCFDREISTAAKLLHAIRSQLTELEDVCEGRSTFTNALRELARSISSGILLKEWTQNYKTIGGISLAEWLNDFCKRVAQLASVGLGKTHFPFMVHCF